MKTQHILAIVGVVVLALLIALLQRSPAPQEVAQTPRGVAPGDPPEPGVLLQADQGRQEANVGADSAAGDEAPAKPAIVVRTDVRRLSNRQVSIGLVLTGSDGGNLPVTSVVRTQRPPGFRIVGEAGQVVAQGSFEYGWGGTCRYTWRVPNDFQGKYQVQVDIDLGSAGAKHERPWHSL